MRTLKVVLPILLFSLVSIVAGCQSVSDIKFATSTRGYNKEVVITPKTVSLFEQDFREPDKEKNTTWKINKSEWNSVVKSLDGVMLREIPLLKTPSNKRAYDGAKASMLTITDKKGKIWYHSFDDENPNEKLMPLMNVITRLTAGK